MNDENLKIPTSSEARKNGRKGGIASGKSRQRRKAASTIMREALQQSFTDGELVDNLRGAGFKVDEPITIGTAYVFSVL